MENASKALIMAGGILIAILVIGALLMMFNNIADYQRTGESNRKTNQIAKFNMEYESYLDDKGITGADILSLINKIEDYNVKNNANQEVNGVVDYNIKMSITISNLQAFNNKYAYNGSTNQFFQYTEYTFGIGLDNRGNNVRSEKLSDELKRLGEVDARFGSDNMKIIASIYDPDDIRRNGNNSESIRKMREKLEELARKNAIPSANYAQWNGSNGINPTLEQIRVYRQYYEFKTSTFKPSRTDNTVYADNGQIQRLFFIFDS